MAWTHAAGIAALLTAGVAARDLTQKKHAILRNFPVLGHGRYLLELVGPELRQYIISSNDEERPFSRDQRSWIYASAKGQNNYFGFGTDDDIENLVGYPIIKHRTFSDTVPAEGMHSEEANLPCAKVLGAARGRAKAYRPGSVLNVSAMSFGSLSGPAIEAINRGVAGAGALHNTGEGGLSSHHRKGGDLILQIGTGYFGCRDELGRFDIAKLKDLVAGAPVRAIEIKLSQGAKPGLGGVLPGAKVTEEIAQIRGVPVGKDVISPSRHAEFQDVDSMLDWVEFVATETGLPVGIKSAVGDMTFWQHLVTQMTETDRGVDFITVDGGEGGTGAAPLVFADSVALPFLVGFTRVYKEFAAAGLTDDVVFVGSAKLGLPKSATVAMALGADLIHVAREAMLSVGCIQAQKCHTGECPTGVATQHPWLARGLDPDSKSERLTNYIRTMRRDLLKVAEAVGVLHPGLIDPDDIELLDRTRSGETLRHVYGYEPGWGVLGPRLQDEINSVMSGAPTGGHAPNSATTR
ncbi:FMN-binding glutamate synthase family protein [Demetria terragena]|uniref:FMN-binding glutamate synthase family protein n=1 Tax=Demetria terragena TaxID=63959 RepID=UPI00036664B8|nr:FMN-binding glutamate synthase family protein [Demetria terragena]